MIIDTINAGMIVDTINARGDNQDGDAPGRVQALSAPKSKSDIDAPQQWLATRRLSLTGPGGSIATVEGGSTADDLSSMGLLSATRAQRQLTQDLSEYVVDTEDFLLAPLTSLNAPRALTTPTLTGETLNPETPGRSPCGGSCNASPVRPQVVTVGLLEQRLAIANKDVVFYKEKADREGRCADSLAIRVNDAQEELCKKSERLAEMEARMAEMEAKLAATATRLETSQRMVCELQQQQRNELMNHLSTVRGLQDVVDAKSRAIREKDQEIARLNAEVHSRGLPGNK